MSDVEPSKLEDHLGYWLRKASNRVSDGFAHELAAQGVSVAEWVALRHLFDHPQLSPTTLAEVIGMTPGAVSKILDKVLAKEWIAVQGNESDRRGRLVILTDLGRETIPALAAIADENDERFFGPLTEEERNMLRRLMERLSTIHGLDDVPTI